jgi:RNA polymerase sigma factor (sigma-70 family)
MEPTASGRPETTIDCDDETLFARYQRDGDKAAFEMLYERRTPDLRQFIKRQWGGGTVAEVEVIVQETFRDLHQCLESVSGEIPIRRLLHKIAKCRLRDAIRHASRGKRDYHRTQCLDPDTTFSDTGRKVVAQFIDPKSDPAVLDKQIEVKDAMGKLPPEEEAALRLVEFDGHTHPSAAKVMNVPETTLSWWVRDGKKRLKELLTT